MRDAFTPFGRLRKKLPVIGQAVVEAIARITGTVPGRYRFALFVFDPEGGALAFTTDVERAALHAMLAEHLTHQSH